MEAVLERVESLAKSGLFGKSKFLRVDVNPDVKMAPNFASQLGFFLLEFENENEITRFPIVTKIQPKSDFEKMLQNSDNQFFSEVAMYTEILPKLGADKLDFFPKFWYGEASLGKHPQNDIVIMEDLQIQGYTTVDELFLAPEAIVTILKKLGEFHGLTYRAKISHQNDVLTLGKSLPHKIYSKQFDLMQLPCIERGFKAVQSKIQSPVLDGALEKIQRSGPADLWTKMRLPKEPFATIIHGDFNKNNLMFKFNGNSLECVKFLDWQTAIYSDPAVDIAFLLYMNTSQATRNAHWDEFLRVYWEGVTSTCPSPGFTFEEFLENFGTRALAGYLPCSFFLPVMLEVTKVPLEEFAKWDLDTKIKRMVENGGQTGTDAVYDIVKDMLDRGYLELYLKRF